ARLPRISRRRLHLAALQRPVPATRKAARPRRRGRRAAVGAGAMKLNRRMERDLADLRSRQVEADSILPGLWPKVQIVEAGGCFLLDGFARKPHLSPADFPDQTGLECSANKLRMEAMLEPR